MAEQFKGGPVTAALKEQLLPEVAALKAQGVTPCLAILRVGEREDDLAYERSAIKRCEDFGLAVKTVALPGEADQSQLLAAIAQINQNPAIHGCLLFRPLPAHIDDATVRNALAPEKDIDGITDLSLAGVFANAGQGYAPCTAAACLETLDHYGVDLKGKRVTVIGRSLVIGKPVAMLLLARHATVTICHTRTKDLAARCREAEILLAAAGAAEMVKADFVREGQTVLDVGVNFTPEGNMVGDVCFEQVEPIVAAVTPVPGGIGGVTTSVLAKHVIQAAQKSLA